MHHNIQFSQDNLVQAVRYYVQKCLLRGNSLPRNFNVAFSQVRAGRCDEVIATVEIDYRNYVKDECGNVL